MEPETLPYPQLKILTGQYVKLEPLNKTRHADGLCAIFLSEDAKKRFRYFFSEPPKSREEEIAWVEKTEKEKLVFVIVDKRAEKVVGTIELHEPVPTVGRIEIWVYFSEVLSRKTGGTEALYLISSYIFDELKYRRLKWQCDTRNITSINAALRFGFTYEALFLEDKIWKNELIDSAKFAIIDDEWPTIKLACEKWLDPSNFDNDGYQKRKLTGIRKEVEHNLGKLKPIDPPPPSLNYEEHKCRIEECTRRSYPSKASIKGRYVLLEPLDVQKHCDGLYELFMNPEEYVKFSGFTYYPPKELAEFQKWIEKDAATSNSLFFTIFDKVSGKIAGRQAFLRINREYGSLDIGHVFWSDLIARKPGATEAFYLFAKHVFDDLGYRRLVWRSFDENAASKRAATRLGFKYEGVMRKFYYGNGKSHDSVIFAMLKDRDWPLCNLALEKWLDSENFDPSGVQKERLEDLRKRIDSKNG